MKALLLWSFTVSLLAQSVSLLEQADEAFRQGDLDRAASLARQASSTESGRAGWNGSKCSAMPHSAGTTSRIHGTARARIAAASACSERFSSRSRLSPNSAYTAASPSGARRRVLRSFFSLAA